MTEQQIQTKRIKELEAEGYYVIKLIKTNKNGIPDLLAIPPECEVLFSEIKSSFVNMALTYHNNKIFINTDIVKNK